MNIGMIPARVTGPAAKACGGCHKAHLINEDDANGLVAFNQHTKVNGYLIDNATGLWAATITKIMSYFE